MRTPFLLWLWAGSALAGAVQGRVLAPGGARTAPLAVGRDQKVCGTSQPDESLVVGPGGTVQGAVVYVDGAPKTPAAGPAGELALDQVGCRFIPHVSAARAGATLLAINSDALLHTVHGTGAGKTAFNQAMPLQGMKKRFPLNEPGVFKATCDAGHTWMVAWIHVFDHPYFAVTGADGAFNIAGLAPGKYTLVVWQETLGTQRQPFEVRGDAPTRVNVTLRAP